MRHLVGNLEREAIDLAHVWPKTYPSLEPERETRCCYWFIGLQLKTARKDDGTPQSLDLTVPIRKFTEVVMSSDTTTVGMWREGMKVEAVYKRRKELAHYLPPDERYKLKAEKASRSQASLAAASRKPSDQQQQQGLKRRNSSVEEQKAAATEEPTTAAAEDASTENGNSGLSAPDSLSSNLESNEDNSGLTAVPSKETTITSSSTESSPPPVKRQKSPPPPTPTASTTTVTTTVSSTESSNSIVENSNGVQVT